MNDEEIIKEMENFDRKSSSLSYSRDVHYLLKVGMQKARADQDKKWVEVIDKILPLCICDEGLPTKADCPNELLDGAWSDSLNKLIKEALAQGDSK